MTTDPASPTLYSGTMLTVGPGESVQTAARLMRQHKYGCLPVVEDGRLVGIITEHDLLEVVERLNPDGSYAGGRT